MSQRRGYIPVYVVHRGQIVDYHNRADGRGWMCTSTSLFGAFLGSAINYQLSGDILRARDTVVYARKLRA